MRSTARTVLILFVVLVASVVVDVGASAAGDSDPDPPPNESWVRIQVKFKSDSYIVASGCGTETYGVAGTLTCEGIYENGPGYTPPFVARRGTVTASRSAASPEMEVVFHYPQAEIRGKVPEARSDRYQATRILGVAGCPCVSPRPNPDIAAGEKGGPLKLAVMAYACCPTNVYDFDAQGWVIPGTSAPAPASDPPDIDIDVLGLDAVTIDFDNQDHPNG